MRNGRSLGDFEAARQAARQDAFGGRSEYDPTDLLPPKARAALRTAAASWQLQRTTRAMEKWADLVYKATAEARTLGFVAVPQGGTKTLAKAWGTSPGSVTRSLDSWTSKGAVEQFKHKGDHGLPTLIGIQIPELTHALVWLASCTYFNLERSGVGGSPMTLRQARKIAGNLLTRRVPLRDDWTTFSQASSTLDLLEGEAPDEAFAMTKPTLTRTRSHRINVARK